MVIKARRSDVDMYLHMDFDSELEKCFSSSSSPHMFTDVCVSSPHILYIDIFLSVNCVNAKLSILIPIS